MRTLIDREVAGDTRLIAVLTKLKQHHEETYHHSLRVGLLTTEIVQELRLPQKEATSIAKGGYLHDIGKRAIPVEILSKQGPLTQEERDRVDKHPRFGLEILDRLGYFDPIVREIVVGHHEYKINPYERKGIERRSIPREEDRRRLSSEAPQIVAAADVFDALSNSRSYKKEMPIREVMNQLRETYIGNSVYVGIIRRLRAS